MKVILSRHGSVKNPAEDPDRSLSEVGRAEIQRVAGKLKDAGVRVARVEHSPKKRAMETAEILAEVVAPGVQLTLRTDLNPLDNVGDWAAELEQLEEDTLLVGHLPFMGNLARVLLGPDSEETIFFSTGTALCLERVEAGVWRKVWVADPG